MRTKNQKKAKQIKYMYITIAVIILLIVLYYYLTYNPRTPQSIIKQQRYIAKKSKKQFKKEINSLQSELPELSNLIKLANLFLNGVPDKYDLFGRKIHGINPDTPSALRIFSHLAKNGYHPALFEIAKIYHYGSSDFEPNLRTAHQFYRHLLSVTPNYRLRLLTQEKLDELNQEIYESELYGWLNLKKPSQKASIVTTPQTGNTINIDTVFRVPAQGQLTVIADADAADDGTIRNDMHNVHDHSVMATIKQSYNKLKEDTPLQLKKNQCCREMREYIKHSLHSDKKQDALLALDTIERNVIPHTGLDATESDALTVVWNRINSKFKDDSETQQTIKDNLANNLAEMVEHGKVCCVTGRLSRVLDSLNIIDDAVQIKPTFAINQEMMSKASTISQRIINAAPESVQKEYNEGGQTDLDEKIKTAIRSELKADYVDTGILTAEGFEAQISKWIDNI